MNAEPEEDTRLVIETRPEDEDEDVFVLMDVWSEEGMEMVAEGNVKLELVVVDRTPLSELERDGLISWTLYGTPIRLGLCRQEAGKSGG